MSRNNVERVLHQLCVDRSAKQRFKEDAPKFLERFNLSEVEQNMVLNFQVKELQAYGINPMLTMGFWQELSPQRDMRTYIAKLRGTESGDAVFSAALKG
jgi:protocatechuate 4,5-dioxygenase alpha chain